MSSKALCRIPALWVKKALPLAGRHSSKRFYLPSRRSPFSDPFNDIQRSFDRFFREIESSFFRPTFSAFFREPSARSLPMETFENGQRLFKIELDLSGFKPEDIKVTAKKGEIILEAKYETKDGDETSHSRQITYRYALPKDADIENIRSLLNNDGRLVIEAPLPQLESTTGPKEIPVKKE